MGAHTPGPWAMTFSDTAGYDAMSAGYEVASANGRRVVVVDVAEALYADNRLGVGIPWEARVSEHPVTEANARLIAAAPDMADALAVLAACVARYLDNRDMGSDAGREALTEAMADARALVVKALGNADATTGSAS